jgi:hypothetical protein
MESDDGLSQAFNRFHWICQARSEPGTPAAEVVEIGFHDPDLPPKKQLTIFSWRLKIGRLLKNHSSSQSENRMRKIALAGLALIKLVLLAGCGGNELESPTAIKLKALGNFYLDYAISNKNQGPANELVFKKHLKGLPDFLLKNAGLDPDAIDKAFVSERDQLPFVIVYGIPIGSVSGKSAPLVAYEKNGVNGRRLVGFANAKVDLVNDSRLEELKSSKQ